MRQVARSSCPDFHIRVADCAATGGDCLTKTKGTSRSKALAILSDKPYKTKRKLWFQERHSLINLFQDDAGGGRAGISIGGQHSTNAGASTRYRSVVMLQVFVQGLTGQIVQRYILSGGGHCSR